MDGPNEVEAGIEALLPRLWRFAIVLTKNTAGAEDLVQDTCERMLRKADRFTLGTRLDRWAFTVMANLYRDRHRRATTVEIADDEAARAVADIAPSPLEDYYAGEVLSAVSRLPDVQRELVLLVCGEGLTYREAAAVVDAPIGTVMSRLHKARGTLSAWADWVGSETE